MWGRAVALALLLLEIVGAPVSYLRIRSWARKTESTSNDERERAYRLRRAQTIVVLSAMALGFVLYGVSASLQRTGTGRVHGSGTAGILSLAAVISYIFGFATAYKAIRPSYARVRGIDRKVPYRGRRIGVGLLFGVVTFGAFFVALLVVPKHGAGAVLGVAGGYILALLITNALLAPFWLFALKASPLPPESHDRLMSLAAHLHGHIRDIKAFPARGQKIANAMQVGVIPGFRYILVSDYLLDHMTTNEVDAVIAHELGHARGNHVSLKLLAWAAVWEGLQVLAWALDRSGSNHTVVLSVATVLAIPVALIATQGVLGIRLERRADDAAAREVGAAHLASALEKLGELNHVRRHTSWAWNMLGQHPGLDQRIVRLERVSNQHDVRRENSSQLRSA